MGEEKGEGDRKSKVEKMKQTDRQEERGIDRVERMGNHKKKRKERRRELAIGRGWKRAVGELKI